jgi:Zn finger protein HypA/HybF involved in hydrogenase expression
MAAHDAWALVCRLFAGGTPVLRATLTTRETAVLTILGKAVKPAGTDQSFVLCPHCQQHRTQVWSDGRGGRMCRCPDCGPVSVEVNDGAALALDEDWLRTKLRLALGIESRDGIDDLGGGVWRLGNTRRSPVLLARDLTRVLHEPALLDRVRVAGGDIRVITPRPSTTRGSPFGAGVQWLALEERFTFYGGGIAFIVAPPSATSVAADPATPVNGPFSADFKWVTLPDGDGTPIRLTDGQAKVFESLWSFKGEAMTADRIMLRAGLDSAKPSDLFKIKAKDKGKPESAAQHAAYRALVVTQQRAGLYAMPCAAAGKEVAMT